MILILQQVFQVALAADPSTYALSVPVELPPSGPVRVVLGPDLVGGHPDALPGGLLLADASGRAIPYAVLTSARDAGTSEEDLYFRPTDATVWETEATDAPIDALVLDVMDLEGMGPFYATVSWREGGAVVSAPRELLYRVDGHEGRTIDLPHVAGPFRVALQAPSGDGRGRREPRLVDLTAVRNAPDHVPPIVEVLELSAPVLTEEGTARYTLRLGGMRSVRALRFGVPASVDVLDRAVTVRLPRTEGYGRYSLRNDYGYIGQVTGNIQRVRVGEARVDRMEVEMATEPTVGDTLIVEVALDRGEPLPIDTIEVVSTGAHLVARDVGGGPHTLYGGATEAASPYDLAIALPDLLRGPVARVVAPTAAPNPAFVAVPTRAGVDTAGVDLSLARFHYERDIVGSPGWARIPVDREVLARSRADLGDLRVIDAAGQQVPFLLWRTGDEEPWATGPLEQVEKGSTTQIRVPLDGTAPVASVLIETSNSVFEREVSILRDAGRTTVALRRLTWQGPTRGGTLSVFLDERIGDALLVRIENGDNPPLAIDAVRVTTPRWELRARIPEGGARLVYGAPGVTGPSYDLSLLDEEVRRMPVGDATLGEERPLAAPLPGVVDRGLTLVGIGLLAAGLLGMVVRVLRGVPAPAPGGASAE